MRRALRREHVLPRSRTMPEKEAKLKHSVGAFFASWHATCFARRNPFLSMEPEVSVAIARFWHGFTGDGVGFVGAAEGDEVEGDGVGFVGDGEGDVVGHGFSFDALVVCFPSPYMMMSVFPFSVMKKLSPGGASKGPFLP
jgi:hypothetical protein